MKVKINENCTGCGLCIEDCDEVFELNGAVAEVIVDIVPEEAEDEVRDAEDDCPTEAIEITEE